jgi:hypothetical protein
MSAMTFAAGRDKRQIFPWEFTPSSLPPTATQLVETTFPFLDTAMLEVPPPMSQDNIVL